jgi:hypothetical protein
MEHMMLRKGDLVKWRGHRATIGIVMEGQKLDWPRILVYWLDCNESSRERIEWMTPLRQRNHA